MSRALVELFIKVFPKFRSALKRGDAFEEEFYKEKNVSKGVYFNALESKNAYSFLNLKSEIDNVEIKYHSIEDAYIDSLKRYI